MNTQYLKVGILSAPKIEISLHGDYDWDGDLVTGKVSLSRRNVEKPIELRPVSDNCRCEVYDVTIGVHFHWERKENQLFKGVITIIPDVEDLVLVNTLDVEDYLASVISSEMKATSHPQLLRAHAVISRSWVLAQILNKKGGDAVSGFDSAGRRIRWYGHDDHTLFDVCADDHCQRYQGVARQTTPEVQQAVDATRGQVLVHDGKLCDARFSKCCGGVFEEFQYCWEDKRYPYLVARRDSRDAMDYPDLRVEGNARRWIESSPEAFCNTRDHAILSQVLNGYDQETTDFYRWTVEYDTETLSELVTRKSGIDFGRIQQLIPLERGTSGRISLLKIVGEKTSLEVGKELEIRRLLSESHLYSSAFTVEKTQTGFKLRGAGWGHGVGLCQIGAAVMADKGYDYEQILQHYFPGSELAVR